MALSPSCNVVANPSFESGVLAPWFTTVVDVAHVSNGTQAFSADYYLDLETAVGNRGNTVSQRIKGLQPGANYTFSLQALTPSYGANYCGVYVYMGGNSTTGAVASTILYTKDEWTKVTGSYKARHREEVLHINGGCTFSGSSYTGDVYFDDVFLGVPERCEAILD
ncbi:carbohydrate binding domain protein [Aspergillus floccosus]